MSDIVERLREKSEWTNQRPYFHAHDKCIEAAAEITRLTTELEQARDKALDEAADACEAHMKQFLDDNDVRKMWPATQARNDVYAGIIRALKSPKPQEATMSEGVGG